MRMRLGAVATFVAALLLTCGTARATVATVGPNGTILLDGVPFFPIGIVHVSWIGDRNGEKTTPDLILAADAGFNVFHPTVDNRPSMEGMFDVASARGVHVIAEIPLPANGPDAFVNRWKDHPAIIAWNVADDFNTPYTGPAYNHPPAEIDALHQHIHDLAPGDLTFGSGGSYPGFRIQEFVGTMDVMGFQSYPLGAQNHPDEYALQENVDSFDWVRDELAGTGQAWLATPQAYRWDGSRYPTPREARNFLYGPLLRGAKGILWYAMWEGADRHLPTAAPALWADLRRQNAEVKSLVPFLLHGTRTELVTGDPRVHATSWRLANQLVVVVLSTLRAGARTVALPLPAGAGDTAHALFPDRGDVGMTVAGGQLVGDVAPEAVHAYVVDIGVPGNQSPQPAIDVTPAGVAFGAPATFDGSGSADPDGTVVAWEWDFGDGTLAAGASVQHTWTAPGTYVVRLTVRDDDGAPRTLVVEQAVGITSLCAPAPRAGCRQGTSTLTVKDPGGASRRALAWTWKRGAVALPELGDPTATAEYALCVYDAGGLAIATGTRPGATWTARGTSGFRLRDPAGFPGGITQAKLVAAASPKGSLSAKGKGVRLPAPALPLAPPVTAQLVGSAGTTCWEGVYGAGARSTATLFKGKD